MQNEPKPFKTALEAAVAYLKGKRIIKKDGDIVSQLDMSKGTFSAYKNGKSPPSKNFIHEFENLYNIKLPDFEPGRELSEHGYNLTDELIKSLKKSTEVLEQRNKDLETNFNSKIEEAMLIHKRNHSLLLTNQHLMAEVVSHATGEPLEGVLTRVGTLNRDHLVRARGDGIQEL